MNVISLFKNIVDVRQVRKINIYIRYKEYILIKIKVYSIITT